MKVKKEILLYVLLLVVGILLILAVFYIPLPEPEPAMMRLFPIREVSI